VNGFINIPESTPDACIALTEASLVDGACVGLQPAFKVSKKRAAMSSLLPPSRSTTNLPMLCSTRSLVSAVRAAVFSLLRATHCSGAPEGRVCRQREAVGSNSWSAALAMIRIEVSAEEVPRDSIVTPRLASSASKAFTQQARCRASASVSSLLWCAMASAISEVRTIVPVTFGIEHVV
jgi:hypothetical protein